jgi:hypothetical protein
MRPVYCLALMLATAVGCTDPIPSEPPTLRGTITGSTSGRFLVVAPGGEAACDHTQRAQVTVGDASIRRRSGGSATTSDLVVGTTVSVWITGSILESCPPIVFATVVVIEEGSA